MALPLIGQAEDQLRRLRKPHVALQQQIMAHGGEREASVRVERQRARLVGGGRVGGGRDRSVGDHRARAGEPASLGEERANRSANERKGSAERDREPTPFQYCMWMHHMPLHRGATGLTPIGLAEIARAP